MLFAIYGEDTFRSREYLHKCLEVFRRKHDPRGHSMERVDGEDAHAPLTELLAGLSAYGLFGTKRLMVIENFFTLLGRETEGERRELERVALNPDSTLVVWQRGSLPKGEAAAFLATQAYSREFKFLSAVAFRGWVKARFQDLGGKIHPLALVRFTALAETQRENLWLVSQEIEKIAHFAAGRTIAEQDIRTVSQFQQEYSAFAIVDSLFARDFPRLFSHLDTIPEDEQFPLVSLLGNQLRTIAQLKEFARRQKQEEKISAAAALSLHPFVVKKLTPLARETTFAELAEKARALVDFDRAAKSSRIPKSALFLHLMTRLVDL